MELHDSCSLVLDKVPSPCGSVDSGVGLSPLALAGSDQLFPFPINSEQGSSLSESDLLSDALYPSLKVVTAAGLSVGGELSFKKVFDFKNIEAHSKFITKPKLASSKQLPCPPGKDTRNLNEMNYDTGCYEENGLSESEKTKFCLQPKTGNRKPRQTSKKTARKLKGRGNKVIYTGVRPKTVKQQLQELRQQGVLSKIPASTVTETKYDPKSASVEKRRSTPKTNTDANKHPIIDASFVPRIVVPPQVPVSEPKMDVEKEMALSRTSSSSNISDDGNQTVHQARSNTCSPVQSPMNDTLMTESLDKGAEPSPNSPSFSNHGSPISTADHSSPGSYSRQASPCYSISAQNSPCMSQAQSPEMQFNSYINQMDGESDKQSYCSPSHSPSGDSTDGKACVLSQYVNESHLSCYSPRSIDSVAFISNDKMNTSCTTNDQHSSLFGMSLDEIDIDPLFFSNLQDTSSNFCQNLPENDRKSVSSPLHNDFGDVSDCSPSTPLQDDNSNAFELLDNLSSEGHQQTQLSTVINNDDVTLNTQRSGRDNYTIFDLILSGSKGQIETFLKQYASCDPSNVERSDENGLTVLFYGVKRGDVGIVDLLLRYKFNVFSQMNDGSNIIHWTVRLRKMNILKLFMRRLPREALNHLINDRAAQRGGRTPLHMASEMAHIELMKALMENGASLTAQEQNNGWSPLHIAVKTGNIMAISEILRFAKTPYAAAMQNVDVVNQRAYNDNTALHFAAELHTSLTSNDHFNKFKIQNDQTSIINLLLEYGASRSSKNHQNQTPATLLPANSPAVFQLTKRMTPGSNCGAQRLRKAPLPQQRMTLNNGNNVMSFSSILDLGN